MSTGRCTGTALSINNTALIDTRTTILSLFTGQSQIFSSSRNSEMKMIKGWLLSFIVMYSVVYTQDLNFLVKKSCTARLTTALKEALFTSDLRGVVRLIVMQNFDKFVDEIRGEKGDMGDVGFLGITGVQGMKGEPGDPAFPTYY